MIGNDIVDMDLAVVSRWKEQRFREKIFTSEEIEKITYSATPVVTLWRFWSMKEAAYKAHQRHFSLPRTFNPKEIKCQQTGESEGIVEIGKQKYLTFTCGSGHHIHSSAISNSSIRMLEKKYTTSVNLKSELLRLVSTTYHLPLETLNIKKDKHFIPAIFYKKKPLPIVFSLSHHGRFSALLLQVNELLNPG